MTFHSGGIVIASVFMMQDESMCKWLHVGMKMKSMVQAMRVDVIYFDARALQLNHTRVDQNQNMYIYYNHWIMRGVSAWSGASARSKIWCLTVTSTNQILQASSGANTLGEISTPRSKTDYFHKNPMQWQVAAANVQYCHDIHSCSWQTTGPLSH